MSSTRPPQTIDAPAHTLLRHLYHPLRWILRTKTSLPERLQATQLKILGIKDADGNAISGTASAGDAGKKVFVTNWEAPSTGRHYIAVGTEGTDRYWFTRKVSN